MLDYLPAGMEKHYTNALIKGIKEESGLVQTPDGIKEIVTRSQILYHQEGEQLFYVADYIKEQLREEWQSILPRLGFISNSDNGIIQNHINSLRDFLEDIMFNKINYYKVAKQLTEYFKEDLKKQNRKYLKINNQ